MSPLQSARYAEGMATRRRSSPAPHAAVVRPVAGAPRGELALIGLIQQRASRGAYGSRRELRLGIGDDCAILRPRSGEEIVVTTDLTLEGRHFRRDWHSPASAGHRTLARGLSDLAAMGARPMAAFLSLALPRSTASDGGWLEGFLDGLFTLADEVGVPLAGGDTAEAPGEDILADIVLLGAVPTGKALRRDGARPGDRLFCTGALGGAAAELQALAAAPSEEMKGFAKRNADDGALHPQLFPQPRLAIGQRLMRGRLATAAIDLSDGLSSDLRHLCEASGVAAEIQAARIPIHPLARVGRSGANDERGLPLALHGGEDYELLFAAPPRARVPRRIAGVALTEIGRVVAARQQQSLVTLVGKNGERTELPAGGWEHLR